jgi:hypothetical protein
MGVDDVVALADAAHVGAAGLAVDFAIHFLTTQDARVIFHDEVPMEPTMYGRLATAMTTAVMLGVHQDLKCTSHAAMYQPNATFYIILLSQNVLSRRVGGGAR